MQFVTSDQMKAIADPYYADRWPYFQIAAALCRMIPGWEKFEPGDVLEIGPYRLPLVPGCDTMDKRDHGLERTYEHDATALPWPISGRVNYSILVALQVFEHFHGKQQEVWQEVRKVADWAIISVPYLWPESMGKDHARIGLGTLLRWTRQHPTATSVVPCAVADVSRIACLYDLNREQAR